MEKDKNEKFPQKAVNAATLMTLPKPRFSICSIVTKPAQYADMIRSFNASGFNAEPECEFLYLDNSDGNNHESYSGYNLFLRVALGKYVILCHQDVSLIEDGFDKLNRIIEELDGLDPDWGLFGNAGGYWPGKLAVRIADGHGLNQFSGGPLPRKCHSLDENFIVVRSDANLALSKDLKGFHFYGTEMCLVAAELGHQAYVVDFYLNHASAGNMDAAYNKIKLDIVRKYSRRLRPKLLRTPGSYIAFIPWWPLTRLANTRMGLNVCRVINRFLGNSSLS